MPKQNNAHNGQVSPKVPSSLATKNKNIEGKVNLIAPIAVTEELDVDDCETESETNEGKFNLLKNIQMVRQVNLPFSEELKINKTM